MKTSVIMAILLERIAFAIIGLLAAINNQTWWSVFMGVMIMILVAGTSIKVKDE